MDSGGTMSRRDLYMALAGIVLLSCLTVCLPSIMDRIQSPAERQ